MRSFLKFRVKPLLTMLAMFVGFECLGQAYAPYHPFPSYGSSYIYNYGQVPKTLIEKNSNLYLFTIVYKDSTIETYKSKIDSYKKDYYLAIDLPHITKSVKPSETISISRVDKKGEKFVGMATDSCWLFKIKTSKINLFSVLAETKTKFVVAIQDGENSPIVPMTRENVEAIIPKSSRAGMYLKNGDLIKAIEIYNGDQ